MGIVSLVPMLDEAYKPYRDRVRCQHTTTDQSSDFLRAWRERHYGDGDHDHRLCRYHAYVAIEGVPMCRRHAGSLFLDMALHTEGVFTAHMAEGPPVEVSVHARYNAPANQTPVDMADWPAIPLPEDDECE